MSFSIDKAEAASHCRAMEFSRSPSRCHERDHLFSLGRRYARRTPRLRPRHKVTPPQSFVGFKARLVACPARPSQTVNYLESHDDYAFIDRLTERSSPKRLQSYRARHSPSSPRPRRAACISRRSYALRRAGFSSFKKRSSKYLPSRRYQRTRLFPSRQAS